MLEKYILEKVFSIY